MRILPAAIGRLARPLLTVALAMVILPAAARAGDLVFNVTYDTASITAAGFNVTTVENAFNYAAQEYASEYSNPIHVNLTVQFGNVGLGQSSTFLLNVGSYSTMVSDLKTAYATDPSAARTLASANFAATDPTGGANFQVSTAEAKALGLMADNTNFTDGTITFSKNVAYTFDPNNRDVAGQYDFIGVAEHEISEVMGRIALFSTNDSADDLFRYTAPGVESFSNTATGVYLSYNGGTSSLVGFNSGGGDKGDYNGANPLDPYNASTSSGQAHALTLADYTNLNLLGWNYTQEAVVPEPSDLALLASGASCLLAWGWRRRKVQGSGFRKGIRGRGSAVDSEEPLTP